MGEVNDVATMIRLRTGGGVSGTKVQNGGQQPRGEKEITMAGSGRSMGEGESSSVLKELPSLLRGWRARSTMSWARLGALMVFGETRRRRQLASPVIKIARLISRCRQWAGRGGAHHSTAQLSTQGIGTWPSAGFPAMWLLVAAYCYHLLPAAWPTSCPPTSLIPPSFAFSHCIVGSDNLAQVITRWPAV